MGERADSVGIDIDGDGLADYEEPPAAWLYYLKGISTWLLLWLTMQLCFAFGYTALEPDIFDFEKAFYLCIVTATTVGYGDVSLTSTGSRLAACFHIVLSVLT